MTKTHLILRPTSLKSAKGPGGCVAPTTFVRNEHIPRTHTIRTPRADNADFQLNVIKSRHESIAHSAHRLPADLRSPFPVAPSSNAPVRWRPRNLHSFIRPIGRALSLGRYDGTLAFSPRAFF